MTDFPIYVTAFLLLFARVGSVIALLPVFSEDGIPTQIRLLAAGAMTLALWALLSDHVMPIARQGDDAFIGALFAELMVGLSLGLVMRLMFQAIAIAGSIISLNIGLSMAMMFDPAQSSQSAILSRFVSVAAAVVCMAMHVHHLWIGGLIKSYGMFPVGMLPNAADFAQLAIRVSGDALLLGLSLAAPVLVYAIVFNVVLGLAARISPAIQVFFIAQPLNLLLGITIIAGVLGTVLIAFANAQAAWLNGAWG
ncbi:flagellar biosynthetic protein FliR [Stakelama pacifica]|uniref:Flagellar biosynthetic protein FliR n=1 Tax=Stakelama pacifica TaxID=517720 RepID=A0A4V6PR80_9SPHN|nr:flagellar biosynthetic protein FliR [Stakelama pacifica]TDN81128.1 flagellar biosynthetic protein FliR [Stakelama pacifica]GGO96838.1 flagellar biosynthetic protein FliR [Stakelama pacifica]